MNLTEIIEVFETIYLMVVPEFTLSQDGKFVYFVINCPNIKAEEIEMVVDGFDFHFWADPYSLVLNFQHHLLDNEFGTAEYDIEAGVFKAKLAKAHADEDFPEILLLSTLKPKHKDEKPAIEVIERSNTLEYSDDATIDPTAYGFAFYSHDFFTNIEDVIPFITDLPQPDTTDIIERRLLRTEKENEDFDPDKIIQDYLSPMPIDPQAIHQLLTAYTPTEQKFLLTLKHTEFLMSRSTAQMCFRAIADVVYSAVYDLLLFGSDGSCESDWTISKISPTLSWFDSFETSEEMVVAVAKRVLVYPVCRNYQVAKDCWTETMSLFTAGRPPVIRTLIFAHSKIAHGEHRWRLNRLYIEPMIIWLQTVEESEFAAFTADLGRAVALFPAKEDIAPDWCIDLLEKYADKHHPSPGQLVSDIEVAEKSIL